jgi:hypothetical protein
MVVTGLTRIIEPHSLPLINPHEQIRRTDVFVTLTAPSGGPTSLSLFVVLSESKGPDNLSHLPWSFKAFFQMLFRENAFTFTCAQSLLGVRLAALLHSH